jgi:hypothetical protein
MGGPTATFVKNKLPGGLKKFDRYCVNPAPAWRVFSKPTKKIISEFEIL